MALAILNGRRILVEIPATAEARVALWMRPLNEATQAAHKVIQIYERI